MEEVEVLRRAAEGRSTEEERDRLVPFACRHVRDPGPSKWGCCICAIAFLDIHFVDVVPPPALKSGMRTYKLRMLGKYQESTKIQLPLDCTRIKAPGEELPGRIVSTWSLHRPSFRSSKVIERINMQAFEQQSLRQSYEQLQLQATTYGTSAVCPYTRSISTNHPFISPPL